jgi:hypothetical protein
VINIVLKHGVSRPNVTSNFGLSKGSFAGNSCTPNGLTCTPGSAIDFSDGGLADLGGSWGIAAGKGSVTVATEYRHHNHTNRASFDPRDQIVAGDAGHNVVAEPNHRWGDPDARDVMTFFDASVPLNRAETRFFYAFGGVSRRDASSAGFYRRSLDARNWPQIYPLGFLPVIEPTVVDASGTAGVRGGYCGWSYDASGQYGHNSFAFTIGDTLNVSLGPTLPPNQTRFDAGTLAAGPVRRLDVGQPFRGVFLIVGRLRVKLQNSPYRARFRFTPSRLRRQSPPSLRLSFGYTLVVGAQNLFDVFPDRNTTVNSFNGIQTFPSQSPFGMNGRTLYARVGRTF